MMNWKIALLTSLAVVRCVDTYLKVTITLLKLNIIKAWFFDLCLTIEIKAME